MEQRPPCEPMLTWWNSETRCYLPDELEVAEGLLAFVPVTPCDIVRQYASLSLTQVLLRIKVGLFLRVGSPITSIIYIFGTFDGGRGAPSPAGLMLPNPAPPEPKFVVVQEQPGSWEGESQLDQPIWSSKSSGEGTRIMVGNWFFAGGLRGNTVQVNVTANVAPEVIEAIGRAILEVGGGP